MKNIVICDVDGTLCTDEHRNHILHTGERNDDAWRRYFDLCHLDPPVEAVIRLVTCMSYCGNEVHLFTARTEDVAQKTIDWLAKHNVPYSSITFRPRDSRVQDNVLKTSWADKLGGPEKVLFVLEDRQRVVDAWRQAGYVCLQVAPGDF